MDDLTPAAFVPAEFKNIFSKPFKMIAYQEAPDLVASHFFPGCGQHSQEAVVRELGLSPGRSLHKNNYGRVPDLYIHELENVRLYGGLIFSQTGDFFLDNVRFRGPDDSFSNLFLPPRENPRPLFNNYYVHPKRPPASEAIYYKEPGLIFDTWYAFGHILVESLPLLWIVEHGYRPKLVLHPRHKSVPAYLLKMVEPFGFRAKDFIIPGAFSIFERLYLARRPYMQGQFMAEEAKRVYARIAAHYAGGGPDGSRLYFSRKKFKNRLLINEAACEEMLAGRGFKIVYPEELSFDQQVRLAAQASHIAGPIGSAMHVAQLFSLNPAALKLLFLVPKGFHAHNFYQLERAYGRTANCVLGEYVQKAEGDLMDHIHQDEWLIDLDNLAAGLEQWLND